MESLIRALNFFAFDGEGDGAEASVSTEEKQPEVKPSDIQYGKSKEGTAPESQVGTDSSADGDIGAEFAELIGKGGRYHDIYGQKVSETVQQRFKNQADLQAQVDGIANDLSPLFMNYGLKTGDFEGLKNAIANDDSFYQAGAEAAGLDVDQYKQNLKLQAEAERGRKIQADFEEQQKRQAVWSQWEADAEELKVIFPNFDLGLEIENNEKFSQLLDIGWSVPEAFEACYAGALNSGLQADATTRATENVVNAIQAKAARPVEGGAKHSAAIVRKSDPSSLSNDDLDEINRRVERGETVSF